MRDKNETKDIEEQTEDVPALNYPRMSDIFDTIEGSRYVAGSVGGIILDRSGVVGGTHTRLYEALRSGGVVIVDKELGEEYKRVMELYYGKGKRDRVGYIYTKD